MRRVHDEKRAPFPLRRFRDSDELVETASLPARTRPRWLLRAVVAALFALAVYAALAVVTDVRALRGAVAGMRWPALGLAVALVTAAFTLRALRWRIYLHRLGVFEPAGEDALGFASGFLMGFASGKGGQVVKAYYLRRAVGLPLGVSVPAIFAERVSDVVSIGLLLIVGLAVDPRGGTWGDVLAPLAFFALLSAFASRKLARKAAPLLARLPRMRGREAELLAGHERLRGEMRPRRLAGPAVVGLAAFLFEALALHVILTLALGVELGVGSAILVLAITDIAAMASLMPGGVGAAEGTLVVLLSLEGVALPVATAATLLFRLSTLWYSLLLGVLATGALHLLHRGPGAAARPTQGSKEETGSREP